MNKRIYIYLLLIVLMPLVSVISYASPDKEQAAVKTDKDGSGGGGLVHLLKVEGVVNPVMTEFISKSLLRATEENAEAVIIQLDTPGGLDLSM
ncbi:MAG: hypothetical protein V3T30_00795, partial [Thermodesulfobacteriota bacterium]